MTTFITNAHVVSDGTILENQDVYVTNQIINNIQPHHTPPPQELKPTDRATIIDADGLFLIPGIIDAHVHSILDGSSDIIDYVSKTSLNTLRKKAIDHLKKTLLNGITTIRDMGDTHFILLDLKQESQKKDLFLPRIFSPGHMISKEKGHVKTIARMIQGTDEDLTQAIKEQHRHHADFIKLILSGGLLSPDSNPKIQEMNEKEIKAAVNKAQTLGLPVSVHAYGPREIKTAVEAGIRSVEHGTWVSEQTLHHMAKKDIVLIPTVKPIHDIMENKQQLYPHIITNANMVYSSLKTLLHNARKHQVKIGMGTDAGTPFNFHGDNFRELELLKEYGLTNKELIQAATTIPAQVLGVHQRLGDLKPGFLADMLFLDADPLQDISAIWKNRKAIMFNGNIIGKRQL